ncbi:MAG: amidohydrolase [Bacillota bacterium]|nr:amidohydrolase [Bacillota bacterium]
MSINEKADLILMGASIYCGRDKPQDLDFIAIRGNKIIASGKRDLVSGYKGENTRVISLSKDQLVLPGLHDNHVHLIQAGILDKYVDLMDTASEEDAAKQVKKFADTIPDEPWILGVGYSRMSWSDSKMPSKETLDRYIPDRPVFLLDAELHTAWLNSKALQLCNITGETPDPAGGQIDRNPDGTPAGCLFENALCLGGKHAFAFDPKLTKELICRYMDKAVKFGVTSVSDMTPYFELDLSYSEVYFDMAKKGELTIRVNAARNLFEDMDVFLPLQDRAEKEGRGMYRIPYMKQFIDGVPTNYTGYLLEDYSDNPGERGKPIIDLDAMDHAVSIAHDNHVAVRLHSCGDASLRAALDAYRKAQQKSPHIKCRHMVEHIEVIKPEDIPRFGEQGVIASVQPEHLVSGLPTFYDNCYPQRLGPEREKHTWPFKTLKDTGAVLAGGSDCPVVAGNPFIGMSVGMTRRFADGKPEEGWNPQQKLTIEDMIDMYTIGAAYAEGREAELGTLEVGKLADITVVDRNLLKEPADRIKETRVCMTIVDGKIVYEK